MIPAFNRKAQEHFYTVFNTGLDLISPEENRRKRAADKIVKCSSFAVHPLLCLLDNLITQNMAEEDLKELSGEIEKVLIEIGEKGLPMLNKYATNIGFDEYVREFIQLTIFKVMDLEGEDRQKACHQK